MRRCRLDGGYRLPMMLPHFELPFPDRLISCQRMIPLECHPVPSAEPKQQGETLQVPSAEWTL
jgi:hypothetical protein